MLTAWTQGLTVQLRPYQRQALSFMLEMERLPEGHQAHFWYVILSSPSLCVHDHPEAKAITVLSIVLMATLTIFYRLIYWHA